MFRPKEGLVRAKNIVHGFQRNSELDHEKK